MYYTDSCREVLRIIDERENISTLLLKETSIIFRRLDEEVIDIW